MLIVAINSLESVFEVISWIVGVASFLSLYCYLSDICFGHETFWRYKSSKLTNFPFREFAFSHHDYFRHKVKYLDRVLLRGSISSKSRITLSTLDDQMIRHILSFLSSKGVLRIGMTSKYYYDIAIDRKLWTDFQQRAFAFEFCIVYKIQCHLDFIEQLKVYPVHLMKRVYKLRKCLDNTIYVIIAGSLYDVSELLELHPGGAAILLEMASKDATIKFDMACHSSFAQSIMQNYLLWSPQKWLE